MAANGVIQHKSPTGTNLWFGNELQFLNDGIARNGSNVRLADRIAVVVGESGTLKSRLGFGFLAHAFSSTLTDDCGAVLVTSEGVDHEALDKAISEWYPTSNGGTYAQNVPQARVDDARRKYLSLVRPILPRYLSSSNFVFRLKLCIREMKKRLDITQDNIQDGWRVRVVIDNWNSIIDSHSSLKRDNQLMQAVFALLKSEGVLALIVATQPGSPAAEEVTNRRHDVTRMEVTRIHTWPVNFFGDRRIAVCTSVPGRDGLRTSIAELSRYNGSVYRLAIGNDFDFYEDLESGRAKRVKLKVKLYSGFDDSSESTVQSTASYSGEVSALFGDLFSRTERRDDVVSFEGIKSYDSFKEYIQNLERRQLDETLVFQVDEFWKGETDSRPFAALRSGFKNELGIDPDFFEDAGQNSAAEESVTRVPLHKDFGLLLADRTAWYNAKDIPLGTRRLAHLKDQYYVLAESEPDCSSMQSFVWNEDLQTISSLSYGERPLDSDKSSPSDLPHPGLATADNIGVQIKDLTVGDIWNSLCIGADAKFELKTGKKDNSLLVPSWELFLQACHCVALNSGKRSFDVDIRTSESLSSLVLEIWFSSIANRYICKKIKSEDVSHVFTSMLVSKGQDRLSLRALVKEYLNEFIYSLRVLIRFLPGRFREKKFQLSAHDRDAVAVRTWFATAVHCQQSNRDLAPLRVPGRYSVRGDWYLAVARGSRSMLLAESAIKKLMSQSMNRKRLREGIGLPVVGTARLKNVDSALLVPEPNVNSYRPLTLGEILESEPVAASRSQSQELIAPLIRLLRSEISCYDACSEEFFQLICSLLRKITPAEDVDLLQAYYTDSAYQQKIGAYRIPDDVSTMVESFISQGS